MSEWKAVGPFWKDKKGWFSSSLDSLLHWATSWLTSNIYVYWQIELFTSNYDYYSWRENWKKLDKSIKRSQILPGTFHGISESVTKVVEAENSTLPASQDINCDEQAEPIDVLKQRGFRSSIRFARILSWALKCCGQILGRGLQWSYRADLMSIMNAKVVQDSIRWPATVVCSYTLIRTGLWIVRGGHFGINRVSEYTRTCNCCRKSDKTRMLPTCSVHYGDLNWRQSINYLSFLDAWPAQQIEKG